MDVNLTDVALNAANIVIGLNFATNCTIAMDWYDVNNPSQYWRVLNSTALNTSRPTHRDNTYAYKPYGNSTLNLDFLQAALPTQYTDNSAVLNILQAEMSTLWINGANLSMAVNPNGLSSYNWTFVNITWYQRALWEIYSACVGPEMFTIKLSDFNLTSNCSATVPFLLTLNDTAINQLDSSLLDYHCPQYSKEEVQFWKTFLVPLNPMLDLGKLGPGMIPATYSGFIDGAVVRWYQNIFVHSDVSNVTEFARSVFDACRPQVCRAAGFSGIPDLDGIGVFAIYLFETALVSILWLSFEFSCLRGWGKIPGRILSSFQHASGNLLDGAMYYLLSLPLANLLLRFGTDWSQYSAYASEIIVVTSFFNFLELLLITKHEVVRKKSLPITLCSFCSFMLLFIPELITFATTGQTGMKDQVCLQNQLNALSNGPTAETYQRMSSATYAMMLFVFFCILYSVYTPSFEVQLLTKRRKIYVTVVSLIPIAMAWFHVALLRNLREAMFIMAGSDWSSSTWGFGQVVALLTWLPAVTAFFTRLCQGEKEKPHSCDNSTMSDVSLDFPEPPSKEVNSSIHLDDEEAQKSPEFTNERSVYWNKNPSSEVASNLQHSSCG
ncbi:uncharacterized protein K444DRAFT_629963 [Hyaloscypha bicolor E]|uniref:Uncharacterized protein n=1 Tax=Hyaloscypha bicolor E TaxID=1095630 RepID=A0A2J6T949_9HELO|nr:uncharacterized protein K444DRAFT_629963 [Hyaloscypha bicolor E]PMD59554.1 hypothetical protein K444DRAFT_629963 [Hyaloscypha bicolor E]